MLSALRIVARRMRSEPGLYVLVIVCLSAGIGATTAVLAVVDASLFRPLAYPDADELVSLAATLDGSSQRYYVSPANFIELRDRSTTFRSLSATNRRDVDLQGEGEPVRLTGVAATPASMPTSARRSTLPTPNTTRASGGR